jgi:hypothetical protein
MMEKKKIDAGSRGTLNIKFLYQLDNISGKEFTLIMRGLSKLAKKGDLVAMELINKLEESRLRQLESTSKELRKLKESRNEE